MVLDANINLSTYRVRLDAYCPLQRLAGAFTMNPGTRVYTPTLKQGTIQSPPWCMPFHTLVRLDSGEMLWFLTEILTIGEVPTPEPRKKRKTRERVPV